MSALFQTAGSEREVELNMMQCVLTGIPRVGKSSFLNRLQGIIPERLLPSTDITSFEGSVRLDIRGSCGFVLHISELGWRKLQAEEEMEGFIALVTQKGNPFQQEATGDVLRFPSIIGASEQSSASPSQETTVPKQESQPSMQQMQQAQLQAVKEAKEGEEPVCSHVKLQAEEEMEGSIALVTQQGNPFQQEATGDVLSFPSTTGASEQSSASPSQETTVPKQECQPSMQQMQQAQPQAVKEAKEGEEPTQSGSEDRGKKEAVKSSSTESEAQSDSAETAVVVEEELPSASSVLNRALVSMRCTELSKRIDSASYVLCNDTGGQPECQELLNLLLSHNNTVFIVLNLQQALDSIPIMEYLPSVDGQPVRYESAYSVEEMLYQSLISVPVDSCGAQASKNESQDVSSDGEFLNRSHVFFIGTHKDMVSPERIEAVNRKLKELIQNTPQFKANVVQQCSAGSIVFPVNNFSALNDDEDFVVIRKATQALVYGRQSKVKVSTSFLYTGVVLQDISKSCTIISLDQCREIAVQCGVEGDSFMTCLKFLHKKMGAIRYYQTENLGDMVIIKPQELINILSHLMKRAFLKPSFRRALVDDEDINDAVSHFKTITREHLIMIGLELLVMCHHPQSTPTHPTYYLTCMLPVNREAVGLEEKDIFFMMEGFVLPIGLGRATITAVVQQSQKRKTPWIIHYSTLYCNSVEFTVGSPGTRFKITCSTKHLRLSVENGAGVSRETCYDVRIAIESIMSDVLKLYPYGQASTPVVALVCLACDQETSEVHYSTFVEEGRLECSRTKTCFGIDSSSSMWALVSETEMQLYHSIFCRNGVSQV